MRNGSRAAILWLLVLALVALFITGCQTDDGNAVDGGNTAVFPDTGVDYDASALAQVLADAGMDVQLGDPLPDTLFPGSTARLLQVDGGALQVYEFDSQPTAEVAGQAVSPEGDRIGEDVVLQWEQRPHFYRWGNLIVVYDGDDPQILSQLEGTLGNPFAGG